MNANLRTMARSSFLPLLLVAALFVVPAFVPSPAPRSVPNTAATSAAAGLLPLLVVQPAMAEESCTWATSCILESLQRENKYTWYEHIWTKQLDWIHCIWMHFICLLQMVHHIRCLQDYMMPPSWPFLLVFAVLASALLVVGNFIFPGKKWKSEDEC